MAFGHELGCGFIDKQHKYIPTEIELQIGVQSAMESVVKIFAGQNRSGVILDTGKLFMWGEWFNSAKQRTMKEIKIKLEQSDRIKKVAIGKLHSMLVTEHGKVFSWGDNTYGELGLGRNIRCKDSPMQIGGEIRNLKIIDIATGARHSIILDDNGRIFAFGDNSEGQCAIETGRSYEPIEIHTRGLLGEDKVKSRFIFCGDSHSAVLTDEGDMFVWGDNSAGRLGLASMSSIYRPTLVDDLMGRNITSIGLGGFFSIAITGPSSQALIYRNENVLVKELFKKGLLKTFAMRPSDGKPNIA